MAIRFRRRARENSQMLHFRRRVIISLCQAEERPSEWLLRVNVSCLDGDYQALAGWTAHGVRKHRDRPGRGSPGGPAAYTAQAVTQVRGKSFSGEDGPENSLARPKCMHCHTRARLEQRHDSATAVSEVARQEGRALLLRHVRYCVKYFFVGIGYPQIWIPHPAGSTRTGGGDGHAQKLGHAG